jgi:hypothetical protein
MKRHSALSTLTALAMFLAACSSTGAVGSQPTAANLAPEASFASPAAGASLPLGKVSVVVQATGTGGVARIELQVNGLVVTTAENPDPSQTYYVLVYDWQPQAGGEYSLQARAQSKSGVWGALSSLQLSVTASEPTAAPVEDLEPTPTQEPTPTPTDVIGANETAAATLAPTQEPTSSGVTVSLQVYGTRLYVADTNCEPQTIFIMATASDPGRVAAVYIAFRVNDPNSADHRGWTKGTPLIVGENGKHFLNLTTRYIWKPIPWVPANVDYMFYALDNDGNVMYRSEIFRDMQILQCKK